MEWKTRSSAKPKKNNGTKRKKQSKTKQNEKWIDFNCQSAFCQEDFRVFLLGIVIRCSNGGHCTKYVLNCDISNWSFVMCIIPFYIWKPKPFAVSLSRISAIGGNWMRQKYFNHSTEPKKTSRSWAIYYIFAFLLALDFDRAWISMFINFRLFFLLSIACSCMSVCVRFGTARTCFFCTIIIVQM